MEHYHLNLYNGAGSVPDDEGADYLNLEEARVRAVESVRSICSDEVRRGYLDLRGRIEVADAAGRVVTTILYSHAVEIRLDGALP